MTAVIPRKIDRRDPFGYASPKARFWIAVDAHRPEVSGLTLEEIHEEYQYLTDTDPRSPFEGFWIETRLQALKDVAADTYDTTL